jgi:hypothetical protein
MKRKIIIGSILLLSLCISPEFNAATLKQKHDNSVNKFVRVNIAVQLQQAGIVVPPLTFTVTNTTTGAPGILIQDNTLYRVVAQEGDVITFNLGGLIGIKQYTITAEDAFIHFASVELLDL